MTMAFPTNNPSLVLNESNVIFNFRDRNDLVGSSKKNESRARYPRNGSLHLPRSRPHKRSSSLKVDEPLTSYQDYHDSQKKRRRLSSSNIEDCREVLVSSNYSSDDRRDPEDTGVENFQDGKTPQNQAVQNIGNGNNYSSRYNSMDPGDLASAMALASLAFQTPKNNNRTKKDEDQSVMIKSTNYQIETPTFCRPVAAMPPPPRPDQWICDFCNVAAFDTFEETERHEATCHMRAYRNHAPIPIPLMNNTPRMSEKPLTSPAPIHLMNNIPRITEKPLTPSYIPPRTKCSDEGPVETKADTYFRGKISIDIPETDSEWLSEMNCYIRSECIEMFSTEKEDVARTSKRGRITLNQVGIRCKFCACKDMKDRGLAAVSYPVSISGIYESVKRWQKVHLESCGSIPADVRKKVNKLAQSSEWVPTTRQYWTESAKAMGMVDTQDGVRFSRDPNDSNIKKDALETMMKGRFTSTRLKNMMNTKISETLQVESPKYIVFPEDESLVPPYVYFLMRQVQPCSFTEADRFIARSKSTIGFKGFECRYCSGHAGLGKYFPTSPKGLSTNSTSQNIYSHLMKCRRCPQDVKDKLERLKREKYPWPRRTSGWRQSFFDKIWERLHGGN